MLYKSIIQKSGWIFLELVSVCPSEEDLHAILAKSIERVQDFDIYDEFSIQLQRSFEEYKKKGSFC